MLKTISVYICPPYSGLSIIEIIVLKYFESIFIFFVFILILKF